MYTSEDTRYTTYIHLELYLDTRKKQQHTSFVICLVFSDPMPRSARHYSENRTTAGLLVMFG